MAAKKGDYDLRGFCPGGGVWSTNDTGVGRRLVARNYTSAYVRCVVQTVSSALHRFEFDFTHYCELLPADVRLLRSTEK